MVGWLLVAGAAASPSFESEAHPVRPWPILVRRQTETSSRSASAGSTEYRVRPEGQLELHDPALGRVRAVGPARLRVGTRGISVQQGRVWVLSDRAGRLALPVGPLRMTAGTSVLVEVGLQQTVWVHDGQVQWLGQGAQAEQALRLRPGRPLRVLSAQAVVLEAVRSVFDPIWGLGFMLDSRGAQGASFPEAPPWFGEARVLGAPSPLDVVRERAVRPSPFSPEQVLGRERP